MGFNDSYPENVQEILRVHGGMLIAHPKTGEAATLEEALPLCVDYEGHNHLLAMLSEMTVESAGVVLDSFAPGD